MNIKRTASILKILITSICILILILPYFASEEGNEKKYWNHDGIFDDFLLMLIYLPFILLWAVLLLVEKGTVRTYLTYTLLIYSFIIFMIAAGDYLLGVYDIFPITARQITLLIFPLLTIYYITLNKLKTAPNTGQRSNKGFVAFLSFFLSSSFVLSFI